MAISAVVKTGELPTVDTNSIDLTETGFGAVDAAIIFVSNAKVGGNPNADYHQSIGFWDGTNQCACNVFSDHGVGTTDTKRKSSTTKGIILGFDGTTTVEYSISNTTDGITITKDSGTTGAIRYVSVILLSGLTNAYVGNKNLGTGTSAVDITDPGFKPDMIFLATIGAGTAANNSTPHLSGFGIAHNSSTDTVTQGAILGYSKSAQADSLTNSYATHTSAIGQVSTDALTWKAPASDFDANGFSLTPSASTGSDYVFYLALEFPNPDDGWVDFISAATSTGNNTHTELGFTPDVVGFSSENTTSLDTVQQGLAFMMSMNDSSTSAQYNLRDEDAQGASDAESEYSSIRAILLEDDAGTTDAIATLSSMDRDGFTLNYSDAASSATNILAFAIGDSTVQKDIGRSRIIPGKGYVKGFTQDTVPAIGFTTSRASITNPDGRPIIGSGYLESEEEFPLIGSGYTLIEQISNSITFTTSENLLTGLTFSIPIDQIVEFTVADNQLAGLDFTPIESIQFGISDNQLAGLDFTPIESIQFGISDNQLAGLDFTPIESIQFSISDNQLVGLDFTPIESTQFDISDNQLVGLDFTPIESIQFGISDNQLAGLDFSLAGEQSIPFIVADNTLFGLDFLHQETTQFTVATDPLAGIAFTQIEQTPFSLSENQLLGLSFDLLELTQFVTSENLLSGVSFSLAGTETVTFNISSNIIQGIAFAQHETSTFGEGINLLEGLTFTSTYFTEFNAAQNSLVGLNFTIGGEESVEFSTADDQLQGIGFWPIQSETVQFTVADDQLEGILNSYTEISNQLISNNQLEGLNFSQLENNLFDIGINEIIGLDFNISGLTTFNISDNQLQGLQFDLLETKYSIFNIANDPLIGLDFVPYQDFIGIPYDAMRFSVSIQRDLQNNISIKRKIRNKVEL